MLEQGGGIHLQNIILAAILAVVGPLVVALIMAGAKKWYFDAQNSLRVEVRAFSTKTSEGLKTIARDSFDANQRSLVNCVGYTKVTITNIARRK